MWLLGTVVVVVVVVEGRKEHKEEGFGSYAGQRQQIVPLSMTMVRHNRTTNDELWLAEFLRAINTAW